MTAEVTTEEVLELTLENVEMVLDEVRPYLMADGGNCSVFEIDGATVKLLLEGACGSCASSAVTMSMGIEKRLKERIPEIESVVQVSPSGPTLDEENVEKVNIISDKRQDRLPTSIKRTTISLHSFTVYLNRYGTTNCACSFCTQPYKFPYFLFPWTGPR